MRWVFQVINAGRRDWHARIRVRVYSADERLLASNDREAEVNARDWRLTLASYDSAIRAYPGLAFLPS